MKPNLSVHPGPCYDDIVSPAELEALENLESSPSRSYPLLGDTKAHDFFQADVQITALRPDTQRSSYDDRPLMGTGKSDTNSHS